jgi:radical SAM protein with 4Fe4S-binding SPASM domain
MNKNKYLKYRLQTSRITWKIYRWYSTAGKYRIGIGNASTVKKPEMCRGMAIWPTNICNAGCVFCAKRKLNLKPKIMGMELFKKAVDQTYKLGIREIGLNPIIGDVLLDKNIADKIRYAKSREMRVSFFTNGILLSQNDNYRKIIDAGTDEITISVGDTDESYDSKIFGITRKASRDRWNGIFMLLRYIKNKKVHVEIFLGFRPIRPPHQIAKTKMLKALRDFPNITIEFMMCYDNWGGAITQRELSGVMRLKKGVKKRGVCISLYNVIILPDGKVRLCGCRIKDKENDELVIGDITVSDLEKIIENRKIDEIREKFAKGMYPEVCKDCTLFREAK